MDTHSRSFIDYPPIPESRHGSMATDGRELALKAEVSVNYLNMGVTFIQLF